MIVREVFLVIGMVFGSALLGMAQKTSNIFYTQPQRALFILLSIFNLFHSAYAVAPPLLLKL